MNRYLFIAFALASVLPSAAFALPLCDLASTQGWSCGGTKTVKVKTGSGEQSIRDITGCHESCTFSPPYNLMCWDGTVQNGWTCTPLQYGVPMPLTAEALDATTTNIDEAMDGQDPSAQDRTSSYWGFYNSTLKSPSAGASSSCAAKIHVCFTHGFSDLTGVTDQNSCNNACNSATNTLQAECYDTDCSSRCGGWWGGTDSCN